MSVREFNVLTGEETVREYTEEELRANAAALKEQQAMAQEKTPEQKLALLGLTSDDIKAIVSK
jgi:hypothetical protein